MSSPKLIAKLNRSKNMKRIKLECQICHKLISKSNMSKHLRGHEHNPT